MARLDCPTQAIFDIEATWIGVGTNALTIDFANVGARLALLHQSQCMMGEFHQLGFQYSVDLLPCETTGLWRLQEPGREVPYERCEIRFANREEGFELGDTLTLRIGKGPFPVVTLVAEAGPLDRNEEMFKHKPFLKWGDYLTRRGVAVLRFDGRGK